MLLLIIIISVLIIIGVAFSNKAAEKNRSRFLWGAIGIFSFLFPPILMINIIVAINQEWLLEVLLIIFGYVMLSIIGVFGAYYILERLPDPMETGGNENKLLDTPLD